MLPGFIATTRALTTADGRLHSWVAPVDSLRRSRLPDLRPGLLSPDSHNWHVSKGLRPGHQQFSLLVSSELLTIPPPTTASPFRHDRCVTLLHRRGLPRLSPGQTVGRRDCRRAIKGSLIARRLPDRLGRIEFTCVADWSFSSGYSPPSLAGTQLPLSDSGR